MTAPRREPLNVAVVQPPCVAHDVATNARTHATLIRAARAGVVVFPELSLTGYELDAPAVLENDARLASIIEACADTGSVALVGAPVEGIGGGASIGILAVTGDGATVAYRKMYLGGDEPDHFSPGTEPAVLEVDGWRLGLAVCKDTRIPEHAAATAALGIDAYVAGMLESAEDGDVPAERAGRVAAEHHVWVAIASFAGSTGGGYDQAAGRSGIWAADGLAIARSGPEVGAIARATLSVTRP